MVAGALAGHSPQARIIGEGADDSTRGRVRYPARIKPALLWYAAMRLPLLILLFLLPALLRGQEGPGLLTTTAEVRALPPEEPGGIIR